MLPIITIIIVMIIIMSLLLLLMFGRLSHSWRQSPHLAAGIEVELQMVALEKDTLVWPLASSVSSLPESARAFTGRRCPHSAVGRGKTF